MNGVMGMKKRLVKNAVKGIAVVFLISLFCFFWGKAMERKPEENPPLPLGPGPVSDYFEDTALSYNGNIYFLERKELIVEKDGEKDYKIPENADYAGELIVCDPEGDWLFTENMQLAVQMGDRQSTTYDLVYDQDWKPARAELYYIEETDICYGVFYEENPSHRDAVAVFVRDDGRYERSLWQEGYPKEP